MVFQVSKFASLALLSFFDRFPALLYSPLYGSYVLTHLYPPHYLVVELKAFVSSKRRGKLQLDTRNDTTH